MYIDIMRFSVELINADEWGLYYEYDDCYSLTVLAFEVSCPILQ